MTHRPDQPPECDACRSDRHIWTPPVVENNHLPNGRLVTLHRKRCQCPWCRCSTSEVRVILPPTAKLQTHEVPTAPLPCGSAPPATDH